MGSQKRQSGVALAIVVWFIAGMSLLVAGIVSHARVDTKMTQIHLARAKAVAAGDGAISLAMVDRLQGYESTGGGPLVSEGSYRLGEVDVIVRLIPADGFVDLNQAPAGVLVALFALAGGVDEGQAKYLADNVVKWRKPDRAQRNVRQRFHALEDLLRVEGVTRSLLDGIRDYAMAADWLSGTMNWSAAPEKILSMLDSVAPGQVDSIQRRRETMMGSSGSAGSRGRSADGGVFRADALVTYGGRIWLRRRWLSREPSGNSSLPWRVVRTEPPRVVEG